jgi:hypothetical protein
MVLPPAMWAKSVMRDYRPIPFLVGGGGDQDLDLTDTVLCCVLAGAREWILTATMEID